MEKKRKLNPLETLLMVYTQTSARTDARPDRQYPFFTGLPLKPYFDRYARKFTASCILVFFGRQDIVATAVRSVYMYGMVLVHSLSDQL